MKADDRHRIRWLKAAAVLLLVGMTGFLSPSTEAASVEIRLIYASSVDRAPLDTRLDSIEFKLRRLFRFESYRLLQAKSVILPPNSERDVPFQDGYSLKLSSQGGSHPSRPVTVVWSRNGKPLMSTRVRLSGKQPTVLGGPEYKNGTLILTLQLE